MLKNTSRKSITGK